MSDEEKQQATPEMLLKKAAGKAIDYIEDRRTEDGDVERCEAILAYIEHLRAELATAKEERGKFAITAHKLTDENERLFRELAEAEK